MVDTKDLKSFGHCDRAGSSPASSTHPPPTSSSPKDKRGIFLLTYDRSALYFISHDVTALKSLHHNITLYIIRLIALLSPIGTLGAQTPGASLLSQGRWIKIHVDTTSVHRIPYTLLKEWGFDNPDNVIIAGYGSVERAHTLNTAPDMLPVLPVSRAEDGIYFYAEGDTRVSLRADQSSVPFAKHYNYYSSGSCYFIGERAGMSSPEVPSIADSGNDDNQTIDSHISLTHTLYREAHPAPHGLLAFSHDITAGSPRTSVYDVTGHDGSARLYYTYGWLHSGSTSQSISIAFSPDVTAADISNDKLVNNVKSHVLFSVKENSLSTLKLNGNADRFSVTFSNPGGAFSSLALVSTTLIYNRDNRLDSRPMTMHFPASAAGARMRVKGVTPSTTLWDISDPRTPARLDMTMQGDGEATATIPGGHTRPVIFACTSLADLPVPTYAGQAANQDLHALSGVDMLIVTTSATRQAALRLAEAHEQWQGMKVAVIGQDEVFNDFSSGIMHPGGLRALTLRLAGDTTRPLRYLLMFGQGSWDTKGTFDRSGREYLVCYGTEDFAEMGHECKLYTPDLYFATPGAIIPTALSLARPKPIVSVGRIPVLDAMSAETYVDKCITYLSDPSRAGAFNHAIVSGSPGDTSQHISCSEEHASIISTYTPAPTIHRAHLSLFALDKPPVMQSERYNKYLDLVFAGDSRIFNYTGHSSRSAIAHNIFNIAREKTTSYRSMPVVVMTSCSTSPIDRPEVSIGQSMLIHNPGPIAVIGAGNEVYLKYNIRFHEQFLKYFYTPQGGECLGDVFRLAVSSTNTSGNQTINNLCYNFLGDPALPRYTPTHTAVLTHVGDSEVTDRDTRITVAPLSHVHLSGSVLSGDGSVDTSFNGRLTICVYEAAGTGRTYAHLSGDVSSVLTVDDNLIFSSAVNVTDGLWEADMLLPVTVRDGAGRMTLNAVSDRRDIACGGNSVLIIDNDDEDMVTPDDTEPPMIHVWLDSPDMCDGDEVSAAPLLHIDITDDGTGVNLQSSAPGMMPKVFIDGTSIPAASYLMHPSDEHTVSAEYSLGELADGLHSVTVTARDLNGNSARETLNFSVVHHDTSASLTASSSIVRDDITFTLTHSLATSSRSERLVIRDMQGRTILSDDTVTFPYTWDLTAADGSPVPDGSYRASVMIDARPYYSSTPEIQFSIIKR